MTKNSLREIVDECRAAGSFLVTSHTGPDGDSIGSVLGMRYFLEALGKTDVTCALQDPVPRIYDWMPRVIEIVDADNVSEKYDLAVVLDVSQRDRIGRVGERLGADQRFITIDHHPEEKPFGSVNFTDSTYASCAEILIDLYETAGLALSKDAATVIYVGLATDTGSFRFGNTDARSHRHAATLMDLGIDVADISARVFDIMSMQKLDLLRKVLGRVERSGCERFAWSYLTEQDMQSADAGADDTEGLVNFVRNLEGIEVAALFRSLQPDKTKVSLRAAQPHNAGQMLKPLGGGGHAGAAGAILKVPLSAAIEQVAGQIQKALGPPPQPSRARQEA